MLLRGKTGQKQVGTPHAPVRDGFAQGVAQCAVRETGCYAADYAARGARNRRGEPGGELHGSPVSPIGEKYEAGCGRNRGKPTKTYTALHAGAGASAPKLLQNTTINGAPRGRGREQAGILWADWRFRFRGNRQFRFRGFPLNLARAFFAVSAYRSIQLADSAS